jgi:hypothetical protein
MSRSVETRIENLEALLSTRPKYAVIDAGKPGVDVDALKAEYYKRTPVAEQAEDFIVIDDPTRGICPMQDPPVLLDARPNC